MLLNCSKMVKTLENNDFHPIPSSDLCFALPAFTPVLMSGRLAQASTKIVQILKKGRKDKTAETQ